MKTSIGLFFFAFICIATDTYAVNPTLSIDRYSLNSYKVCSDSIGLTNSDVQKFNSESKKLKWFDRLAIKIAQKSLIKKLSKQHPVKNSYSDETTENQNPNKRGLFSLILVGAGLVTLFLPSGLAFLGVLFAAAGFVIGIIGLKKDEDIIMALIGTIVGGLVLALLAIILFA